MRLNDVQIVEDVDQVGAVGPLPASSVPEHGFSSRLIVALCFNQVHEDDVKSRWLCMKLLLPAIQYPQ